MTVFLFHAALLGWASWHVSRRLLAAWPERLLCAFMLFWGNLAVTGLLLSQVQMLGRSVVYFHVSVGLGLLGALWASRRPARPLPHGEDASLGLGRAARTLPGGLLLGSFGVILLATAALCFHYSPTNWDSLTYHLPRVLLYLSQGSLKSFLADNQRLMSHPFNETLFRVLLAQYGQPDWLFNLLNLASWFFGFLGAFVLGRRAGLPPLPALAGAWLALLATQCVAQASSTTNDLVCATPLVATLVFVMAWLREGRLSLALLAGLSFALAFGSKLTVAFFGPAMAACCLAYFGRLLLTKSPQPRWPRLRKALLHGFLALALFLPLATPFMVYNMQRMGSPVAHDHDHTLNKPFKLRGMLQTMYGFAAQVWLNPWHELVLDPPGARATAGVRQAMEQHALKRFFFFWKDEYTFSELYVFPPDLNEDHVFFGFAGPLLMLAAVWALLRPRGWRHPAFWISLLPVGWFLAYCAMSKWSLYNQRYFNSLALLSGPAAGLLLQRLQASRSRLWKPAGMAALGLVVATGFLFAWRYVSTNSIRNLPGVLNPGYVNPYPSPPRPLAEALGRLPVVTLFQPGSTHKNERIYPLMRLHPRQNVRIRQTPDPERVNLVSHWAPTRQAAYTNIPTTSAYALLPLPGKKTPGVADMGRLGESSMFMFRYALWNDANATPALENANVMAILRYGEHGDDRLQNATLHLLGLQPEDGLRLRVHVTDRQGETSFLLETDRDLSRALTLPPYYRRLSVQAVDADGDALSATDIVTAAYDGQNPESSLHAPTWTADLVEDAAPAWLRLEGFGKPEGPYPHMDLPPVRWIVAEKASVRLVNDDAAGLQAVVLRLGFRPHARPLARVRLLWNGEVVEELALDDAMTWTDRLLRLPARPGVNELALETPWDQRLDGGADPGALRLLLRSLTLQGVRDPAAPGHHPAPYPR